MATELSATVNELLRKLQEMEAVVVGLSEDPLAAESQQGLLVGHTQDLVAGIERLHKRASDVKDVTVPTSLLEWIDRGDVPDEFIKVVFKDCLAHNQIAKGIISELSVGAAELGPRPEENAPAQAPASTAAKTGV